MNLVNEKSWAEAITYSEQILKIEPGNEIVLQYIPYLRDMKRFKDEASSEDSEESGSDEESDSDEEIDSEDSEPDTAGGGESKTNTLHDESKISEKKPPKHIGGGFAISPKLNKK